jgi:uncharacterized protein involved in exopolysaccharide biosynthesis
VSNNHEESIRSKEREEGVTLLDLLTILARRKWLILSVPATVALISIVVSLLLPLSYTAKTSIMTPSSNESVAMQFASQGSIVATNVGGAASFLGLKSQNEMYVAVLRGRTIADALIERFRLKELYGTGTLVETRMGLENRTQITTGRDNLIGIQVSDSDPRRAAELANAYVEELEKLLQSQGFTEAAQRRALFEKQVRLAQEALTRAELDLRQTQERTGLVRLDEQAKAIVDAIAEMRAQIAAREVRLEALKVLATDKNPEVVRLKEEITAFKTQLGGLERSRPQGNGDIFVPTGKVPEYGLEYVRKLREVRYQESLYTVLSRQYEIAKVDEIKNLPLIPIVDRAVPPDRKSKPRRALIVVMSTFIASVLAIIWVIGSEMHRRAMFEADYAQGYRMFWESMKLSRKRKLSR